MHLYSICGLSVQSELSFPELSPNYSQPEIIIRFSRINELDSFSNSQVNVFFETTPLGKFLLNKGCEVVIEPAENIKEDVLRNFILGPVLATLLRQRGLIVFHGSAVSIYNSGVAFLGHSGWGKSTLASAFHKQGYGLITDDVMAVEMKTGFPMALPSFPKTKLWKDAANAMEHNVEGLPKVHSNSEKYINCIAEGFAKTPLPLSRIYILAVGKEHKIEPIKGRDALMELLKHSHGVDLLELPELATSNFNQCLKLLEHVSVRRLVRSPSLSQLTESIRLVEEDITQTVC